MATTKRRRRRGPKLLIGGLILLAILWCGYWYAASTITAAAIERAATSLAARGRSVTCAEKGMAGFPLSLDLTCRDPAFIDPASGLSAEIKGVRASAPLYWPGEVNVGLAGPLSLAMPGDVGALAATWSSASARIDVGLGGLSSFAVSLDALNVVPNDGAKLPLTSLIGGHADMSASPAGNGDYRLTLTAVDVDATLADGRALPKIGLAADVTALQFGSSLGTNPAGLLRDWLRSGGTLRVDRVALSAVRSGAAASGTLTLSTDGLLSGSLTVRLIGLDGLPDLAEAFRPGSRDRVAQVVAMISGIARPVKQGDGTAYEIPLGVKDGTVALGGLIPIGQIPALKF